MCLASTYPDLKTLRQVSLYRQASDLEMNRTSSILSQSDKLVIVLHLLLAPVGTQWWRQQSTKLFVIEVRFRWRRDASRCDNGWRYDRLVEGQGSDTILNPSEANILLVINDLVVNDPVRLITCGGSSRELPRSWGRSGSSRLKMWPPDEMPR